MIKKLFTVFALAAVLASTSLAQWQNLGAWPDTSYKGGTHGIAVDPDGKVWVSSYFKDINWITGTDTIPTSGILVFNPDGTQASFSPIVTITTGGGFVVDTLKGNCRGMGTDEAGNILYCQSGSTKIFKIDYKTGEGLAKGEPYDYVLSSLTAPACDAAGNVFVGPVVGGGSTAIVRLGPDLQYIDNAVVGPPDIARTMEVSADGNTIYWSPFTGSQRIHVYNRADEFSAFELKDSLMIGSSIESSAWNPATGLLWVSNDARGANYSHLTWYGIDVATKEIKDSLKWVQDVEDLTEYPRGLDFTADGMTAYIGTFTTGTPRMQKVVYGAPPTVSIEFVCDMTVQISKGNFDKATGTVTVAGDFQGWSATANPLTDPDGDGKYSATIDGFNPGSKIAFKFVKNGADWETVPNREYTVPSGNSTYEAFWDNDNGAAKAQVNVTFLANMEYEIVSGRFNPSTDTLSVRGNFNGWSNSDVMAPSLSDPNTYELTKVVEALEGDILAYKFAFDYGTGGTNWEGGSDRQYTFTADDIANLSAVVSRTYNDLTLDNILNQDAVVKFVCDMNGAINNLTGSAFPSVDNVFIAGAVPPLNWPGGGWPDSDINLVHFLKDDGTQGDVTAGDGKWTIELTFPIYSPLTIQYKYGANWGLASNGGSNDNEAGVGADHFIHCPPNLYYGVVDDKFGTGGDIAFTTGVKEVNNELPTNYSLQQNYPNPFNPSTSIRFSIPESGLVTLRVFDMLGQEVASLLNEVKGAGNYEVSFDASKLTSGMYVYTLTAGKNVISKKMMLVK
jgi:hypothetical protein